MLTNRIQTYIIEYPKYKITMSKQEYIIGIDLGTTNSACAAMIGGEATIIPNSEGSRTTPSIVAFTKTGERVVGQAAKRQSITNPKNTIFSAKRLMGRKFSEVKDEIKNLPYKVVEGPNGDAWIEVTEKDGPRKYSPQQIAAFILGKIKADSETFLGGKVSKAVITVPAYFNDAQRQATKDAGTIAGLEVLRIVNEPTAASLAYGLDKKTDEKIAVFDLGGGTFDVTVLEIGDGVFEVKSTNGDTHLGGDDWDKAIMDWIMGEFKKSDGIDLANDPMALQRVREEAEKVKIALSSTTSYTINLPFITADATGPKHLNIEFSRTKMEQICDTLFDRMVGPYNNCVKDSGIGTGELDELVLVGGMTRMPKVAQCAESYAGKAPNRGVNPDEVVAIGAAIQAGVLSGEVNDILLLDVTPLTLSIETAGGVATPMIPRNTTIPTRKANVFSTFSDHQPKVEIVVLQGERPLSSGNKTIGKFSLDGIPPSPRGVPQIEVTFDIDANGILHVSAKDLGTGKEQKIQITDSSGLTTEEVERMKKDAEDNAASDSLIKEKLEVKNQLDGLIYSWNKYLEGDDVPDGIKQEIKSGVEKGNEAVKSDDVEKMRESISELTKLGEKVYKKDIPKEKTSSTDENVVDV
jgi:molecular chaperone DnaK